MREAGAAKEDRKLVLDEFAAAIGEDRWSGGEAWAFVGGESSDETFICQHAGADRWTAASVGIAQAATSKKPIPISPGNGGVSEKAGSGSRGDGFLGLGKSGWKPLVVSRRKYWAGSAQLKANGFILTSRRAKKLIPVKSGRRWREETPRRLHVEMEGCRIINCPKMRHSAVMFYAEAEGVPPERC